MCMNVELFKHNKVTYENILEIWKESNRVAIVQPTGSGKSYVILKCCEDYDGDRKVIFAPTKEILNQFDEHMQEYKINNYEIITYSKLAGMTQKEIVDIKPSLIIFDEFHRCGAAMWGEGVNRLLDTYPDVKVLGASATPIRYLEDGRDMSDELFDGHLACNMSLADALVDHILPMPKYVSALYTLDEEIKRINDKIKNSSNSEENKKELKAQVKILKRHLNKSKGIPQILKKYLTESKNGKFIIFCRNIAHLNEMKETVVDWFKKAKVGNEIHTYSIYSEYEEGSKEYDEFKNDKSDNIRLLFTIAMLNEGVHLSDITGAILLRTTISPIIYYQQIGRVIDADKNKNFQPIIFDFVNNFDNIRTGNLKVDIEEVVNKRNKEGLESDPDFKEIDLSEFRIFDEIKEVNELMSEIEGRIISDQDKVELILNSYNNGNYNIYKISEDTGLCYGSIKHLIKKYKLNIDTYQNLCPKNISYNKKHDVYMVRLIYKNKQIYIGQGKNIDEAIKIRDNAKKLLKEKSFDKFEEFLQQSKQSMNNLKRKVNQFDMNGNLICQFESISEAGRCVGDARGVQKVLNKNTRSYKGYKFESAS